MYSRMTAVTSDQVLVHNPYEFPEVNGKGFAVGSGKEAFLAVSAQVTERQAILEEICFIDIHQLNNITMKLNS